MSDTKAYPDEPPAYSPPPGGMAYPPGSVPASNAPYPPGQMPPPQPGYGQPVSGHGVVTVTTVQAGGVAVTGMGNCPNCRVGYLSEEFSLCGILLAIFCFPIGILCCLVMRERKCNSCGSTFSA